MTRTVWATRSWDKTENRMWKWEGLEAHQKTDMVHDVGQLWPFSFIFKFFGHATRNIGSCGTRDGTCSPCSGSPES